MFHDTVKPADQQHKRVIVKSFMNKTVEFVTELSSEMAKERLPFLHERYEARQLNDADEIQAARSLSTKSFIALGKYENMPVTPEGVPLHDPLLDMSTFFASFKNSEMQVSTRLLWHESAMITDLRLPTDEIDSDMCEFLHKQAPGAIAEIGSLAKQPGVSRIATLKALREVFLFASEHDIEYFVCGLEPKVLPTYQRMFGGALTLLLDGDKTVEFPGVKGDQVPLMIEPLKAFGKQRIEMQDRTLGDRALGFGVRHFFKQRIPSLQ